MRTLREGLVVALLVLSTSVFSEIHGQTLQSQPAPPTPSAQQPEIRVASGALVGLTGGQTLWIAPIDGKIRVIASPDYVIPRKSGFWRIRPEFRSSPSGYEQLWAVPLKKGKRAAAWPPRQEYDPGETASSGKSESVMETMEREAAQSLKQDFTFLSPDYLSLYSTQTVISSGGGTGQSATYSVLQIVDPAEIGAQPSELLFIRSATLPLSDAMRSKDLKACIDPNGKEEFRDEDFLTNAQDVSYGIRREQQKWTYGWLLGYPTGALRGYYTECPVSALPPASIVGRDELFPDWKLIQAAYPNAQDAFSSPAHDLLLVFSEGSLQVLEVRDGKIGNTLAQLQIEGQPIMVQWVTGRYTDAWTNELKPDFETYRFVSESERQAAKNRRDAEGHNARGIMLMRQKEYEAAGGEFSQALELVGYDNAEYLNNLGCSFYKDEDYDPAVRFLEESIEFDPNRAIAYLNLADALAKLNRNAEARQDYAKYLELAPNSKLAPDVRKKLDALPPAQ
jgi:tetratricopeptide (TPR) repeat protein